MIFFSYFPIHESSSNTSFFHFAQSMCNNWNKRFNEVFPNPGLRRTSTSSDGFLELFLPRWSSLFKPELVGTFICFLLLAWVKDPWTVLNGTLTHSTVYHGRVMWAAHHLVIVTLAWMILYCSYGVVFLQKSRVADLGFVWWGAPAILICHSLEKKLTNQCYGPSGWKYRRSPSG